MKKLIQLRAGEVALFGYGSLLLQSSMEKTLGRPYEYQRYVCHVSGWRRTWDSLYPNQHFYHEINGERRYPKNILYLNASRFTQLLNGILYIISEEELAAFDKREAVYTRLDIREDLTDIEVRGGTAWMYVGIPPYLLKEILPAGEAAIRRTYLDVVEAGLKELGAEFSAEYRQSSDTPREASIIDDRID